MTLATTAPTAMPSNDSTSSTTTTTPATPTVSRPGKTQLAVGLGLVALAGLLAIGARDIKAETGYAGVSAAFLPYLVAVVLGVCGGLIAWLSLAQRPQAHAAVHDELHATDTDWTAMLWVSAGLLANAALIQLIGFVLSCALLFVLAARGVRHSMGQPLSPVQMGHDLIIGILLSAPVFWLFTRALGVMLPRLLTNGWI